jgi:hypothetical protein
MAGLLESAGAQSATAPRGKPIHVARMETGLFTNRSALHDSAQYVISKFYGGYIDALLDGSNMEVSNALTLIRRAGLSQWSNQTITEAPNWFYEFRKLDNSIDIIVDTPVASYFVTPTSKTTVFTKSGGAGQGYYQGVGNTLYYGDGIDLQKWDGTTVWNWGIATPLLAPKVLITESTGSSTTWVPSTVMSAMGILVDGNGNVQQLVSVNADGSNPNSRFGLSGNGGPSWNQTPGLTTTDGTVTWKNFGPIAVWTAATVYNSASGSSGGGTAINPCIIYDPTTQCAFFTATPSNAQGTSGNAKPSFQATFGWNVHDPAGGNSPPNVKWWCLIGAAGKVPPQWSPSHAFTQWGTIADNSVCCICEPTTLAQAYNPQTNSFSQTVYLQVSTNGGTSGTGTTAPPFSSNPGELTSDNQLSWLCLGTATRATNHAYTAWTGAGQLTFSVIKDSNSNIQVCTTSGTSSATATGSITWATTYGAPTQDGGVTWTCVGNSMSWAANTKWFLPTSGFFAPTANVPYGGASVVDSNNNIQFIIGSGKTGTVAPSWHTVGLNTTDNAATWYCEGAATTNSLSWTSGYGYGVSYTSRATNDIYNTTTPPGWTGPLGPPTGAKSGHVSTSSPIFTIAGGNPGAINTLSGLGSTDPQVDTITIWRTLDGGATLFFLTEIPNPATVNGNAGTWTYQDFQPDTVVNELISAPVDDVNDPPPAGFLPMAYHFERIWGAVGNIVYCSGGPDTVTGNPNEAFSASDFFEFPSTVTNIVPTATGILVFTTSDVYGILGGPSFVTFYGQKLIPGVGLLHYNAIDIHGGVVYMFTADSQLVSLDPSGGVNRIGGPIADKLQNFDPTKAFVTVHESGNDNCVVIGDGSTGWYRLNPNQFPNTNPVWSPFATITGGAGAVQSIEVSKGVHRLLVGRPTSNGHILQRDFSTFQDDGTPYTCSFTMGSINLVNPGQIAGLTFVNVRATKVGTAPTVGFLLNEVSGSFTNFTTGHPYPWEIYGNTSAPTSLYANAYYFRETDSAALAEHLLVKVSFPAENFANEVLTLTVWGVIGEPPEEL